MPKFIGIQRLWYTDVIAVDLKQSDIKDYIDGKGTAGESGYIPKATEVLNIHQDTWGYSQDDPSTTDYKNELTGENYFRDLTERGNKTISFTMGEYDYKAKADLQGGEVIESAGQAVGWKSSGALEVIHKGIIALTKTGTYIVFTNANIVGKGDQQQKAVGLGISAVAEENPAKTEQNPVEDEYWFDAPSA